MIGADAAKRRPFSFAGNSRRRELGLRPPPQTVATNPTHKLRRPSLIALDRKG